MPLAPSRFKSVVDKSALVHWTGTRAPLVCVIAVMPCLEEVPGWSTSDLFDSTRLQYQRMQSMR